MRIKSFKFRVNYMSKIDKLLTRMRTNATDWRIEDIEMIAKHYDVRCRHNGGSHYVFGSPEINEIICIPKHKPIKQFYIKSFLKFIDQAIDLYEQNEASYGSSPSF